MYKYILLISTFTILPSDYSKSSSSSSSDEEKRNKNILQNNRDLVIHIVATLDQHGTIKFASERINKNQKTIYEFFPLKNPKLVYDPSIISEEKNAAESSAKFDTKD